VDYSQKEKVVEGLSCENVFVYVIVIRPVPIDAEVLCSIFLLRRFRILIPYNHLLEAYLNRGEFFISKC